MLDERPERSQYVDKPTEPVLLPRNESCPCDSGRKAKKCCRTFKQCRQTILNQRTGGTNASTHPQVR